MSVLIDSSMFFVIKCKDGAIYHLLTFSDLGTVLVKSPEH